MGFPWPAAGLFSANSGSETRLFRRGECPPCTGHRPACGISALLGFAGDRGLVDGVRLGRRLGRLVGNDRSGGGAGWARYRSARLLTRWGQLWPLAAGPRRLAPADEARRGGVFAVVRRRQLHHHPRRLLFWISRRQRLTSYHGSQYRPARACWVSCRRQQVESEDDSTAPRESRPVRQCRCQRPG